MTKLSDLGEIRGQARVVEALSRAWSSGRVSHAYLFQGPEGVGKRTTARAFAALLLCDAARGGAVARACGSCRACRKMGAGQHPDYREVEADGRFIKIDQVRELQGLTHYRPYEAARRVIVLVEASTLKEEAANALLKTLEEPTGETVFVLTTGQPHRVLPTIRSRCQPMGFTRLQESDVEAILVGQERDPALVSGIAPLSEGSVRRAVAMLDSPVWASRVETIERLSRLGETSMRDLLGWAEALASERERLEEWLDLALGVYRDAAVWRATGASSFLANRDAQGAIARIASGRSTEQLQADVRRIGSSRTMLLGNVHPRMVMETLLSSLAAPSGAGGEGIVAGN